MTNLKEELDNRAVRRSWGTIVLSIEQTKLLRKIPSFQKKNKRCENIGTIIKGTNGNSWKRTCSYCQEPVLSSERILNQEFVLNHLEIIKISPPLSPMQPIPYSDNLSTPLKQ